MACRFVQRNLVLNSWLQTSDRNYLSGRVLWLNLLINGGSNLLWLSVEQLIKILIIHERMDSIIKEKDDLDTIHDKFNNTGKRISSKHKLNELIKELNKERPEIDLDQYEPTLSKIQEYYERRYVVREGSSISITLLNSFDKCYFYLRDFVSPDIAIGLIDEIFIQKKNGLKHPLPIYSKAYEVNPHFRTTSHGGHSFMIMDGKKIKYTIKEDGT